MGSYLLNQDKIMNPSKTSNQSNNPDQSVVSSDQAQPLVPPHASGSSLQSAQAETDGTTQPEGDPVEHPIATNFSAASSPGAAKTAAVSSTDGPFEAEQDPHGAERVTLQNNPHTPDDESVQGDLPDTNPISRPMDSNANLPD